MDNSNILISQMNLKDLESIKPILETDFDDFWNYSVFKTELENTNSKYFVLKKENEILGFVGFLKVLDEAEITNIVIKKSFRRNHLSKLLIEYIINYCNNNNISKIHLEVKSTNLVAINLYKSFDFKEVGLRKGYYKNEDAILFTKKLKEAR